MEYVEICSKQAGVKVTSQVPKFEYFFKDADVPVKVMKAHVDKILSNEDFYLKGKKPKEKHTLDLNNDGVFDEKDVSIAARTLSKAKKLKKKK